MVASRSATLGEAVKACEWLISKGADPLKEVNGCGTVQIHTFSSKMARITIETMRDLHGHQHERSLSLSSAAFANLKSSIQLLYQNPHSIVKDPCRC